MSNSLEKAFNGSALNYKPSWVYAQVWAVTGTKNIGYYMECIYIFSGRGSIVTAKEGNTIISNDYGSYLEYVEQLSHATMAEPPLRPKSPLAVRVSRVIFLSRQTLRTPTHPVCSTTRTVRQLLVTEHVFGERLRDIQKKKRIGHSFGQKKNIIISIITKSGNFGAALSCVLAGNPLKPNKFREFWETNAMPDRSDVPMLLL